MRKKHTGRALVIQIGEADIRIAGTSLGASAPQLSYSTVIPTPEGAVEDGAILDPEALQEALREPLSAPEIQRIRKAVFVLCSTQVLSGTAAVPPGAERQMDKLLSANADLYFPVDTADYHLVWSPAGVDVDENGDRVRIMQLWAVPNGILDRYYALANGLGLSVEAVDYCGSSIAGAVGAAFDIPQAARRVRGGRKAEAAQAGEAGPGAMPAETQLQAAGTAAARRSSIWWRSPISC